MAKEKCTVEHADIFWLWGPGLKKWQSKQKISGTKPPMNIHLQNSGDG